MATNESWSSFTAGQRYRFFAQTTLYDASRPYNQTRLQACLLSCKGVRTDMKNTVIC